MRCRKRQEHKHITHRTYLTAVIVLPLVSQNRTDDNTSVLDHHLSSFYVALAEKATSMNSGSTKITYQLNRMSTSLLTAILWRIRYVCAD